jgi:glyoxylase-like metal-dependent hydrolase (beta-lactamase superfamily II)
MGLGEKIVMIKVRGNSASGLTGHTVSRRGVLAGGGAAAASLVTGLGGGFGNVSPAFAAARSAHSFKIGEFEITVVSDGNLTMPARLAAPDVPEAKRNAALNAAGQQGDMAKPPTNVTVIKTGDELILIDAGSGPNFMPTAGKLSANLEAAGISADNVTKVIFTHGHPDHLWGVLDDFEEEARFPNATHYIGETEWDYWISDDAEKGLPEDRATFVAAARRRIKAIEGKAERLKTGVEIIPGLQAFETHGHTQGHLSLELAGGGETLVILGDALIHPVISFAHPEWQPAADHVREQAVETRKKLLDKLATDKSRVIGYHLPFPGIGRVEKKNGAFAYVAAG